LRITTKEESNALWQGGKLGNALISWPNIDEYLKSDYSRPVVLRYKVKGKPWVKYGLNRDEVPPLVNEWAKEGAEYGLFTVNELAEDSCLVIQGEVWRDTVNPGL
jgi:hypothetical protein